MDFEINSNNEDALRPIYQEENIKIAIDYINKNVGTDGFLLDHIFNLNKILMNNLNIHNIEVGVLRKTAMYIRDSNENYKIVAHYENQNSIDLQLAILRHNYLKNINIINRLAEYHCKFLEVHPFNDGNGRTARFLLEIELYRLGYSCVIEKDDNYCYALGYYFLYKKTDEFEKYICLEIGEKYVE